MADWLTELEDELKNESTPTTTTADVPTEAPEPLDTTTDAPAEAQADEQGLSDATQEATTSRATSVAPEHSVTDNAETPAPAAPAKEAFIPKSRLDEEIDKRRRLEDERNKAIEDRRLMEEFVRTTMERNVAQRQPQQPQVPKEDPIEALYKQEIEALMDGDTAAALQLRRQADDIKAQQYMQYAMQQAQQTTTGAMTANNEEYIFQTKLAKVTSENPFFDESSDQYDSGLTNMALTIGKGLLNEGVPKTQILDRVMEVMTPVLTMRQQPAQPSHPPAPIQSVQQKVAAARAQPPATQNSGSSSRSPAKHDVMSMTVEDFERLPQDEINRLLRGG
jgi:hypothetical protein